MDEEEYREKYIEAELVGVYSIMVKSAGVEYPYGAVMLLKGREWGNQVLPIYIGKPEAEAIARAFYGTPVQRPLTHDLIVSILESLDIKVERITIDALINNVYTATIVLLQEVNGKLKRHYIDARPSDSVAIAIRTGAPIFLSERLKVYTESEERFSEGTVDV
ncbi:MAG: bifunctional nuclease family protein [Thermofilaceae archaeon]